MAAATSMSHFQALGRSSGAPEHRTRPEVLSFEKDLSYELATLKKLSGKREDHALRQRLSNGFFQLWGKYERRLRAEYFAERLLSAGDALYSAKEYELAAVHCYGRYLQNVSREETDEEDSSGWIVDYCLKSPSPAAVTLALRAAIGDAVCRYYTTEKNDRHLMRPHTQSLALSTLHCLQACSQAALQREAHYWLAYNCTLLIYSVSRQLMAAGLAVQAVEPLLWAAVCMEFSVPLMAVKFLRLRADIYTAVCQCYFYVNQPYQAELFARRGLDRVHELALLEHQSSSLATEASEAVFREATLKLGVMVFRRSVLESRIMKKGVFRPKKRPSIREMLQQPSPRSPTEKLMSELFTGEAAQFLSVMEALAEPSRRPLEQGPPRPVTNLDPDITTDVIQELLCAGTDLVLRALGRWEREEGTVGRSPSLLAAAVEGLHSIPLSSVLCYVRMAVAYEQREVVDLLAERALALAKLSSDAEVHRQYVRIQLLQLVNNVRGSTGRRVTLPGAESNHALTEEPGDKLGQLSTALHTACSDPALLEWERDLLQDSVLFLWETICPAFSRLHSHHTTTVRPLAGSKRGKEYAGILEQVVEVARSLEVWREQPQLCGEMALKLACLSESSATDSPHTHHGDEVVIPYDRATLLKTLAQLDTGLRWVGLARADSETPDDSSSSLALLHAELLHAASRVRVKLAATTPSPATPEPTLKPSSLRGKVRERREKQDQRQVFLASLSAHDTAVQSVGQLREECGSSRYHTALVAMLDAAFTPQLPLARKTALLQEAVSLLQQLDQELIPSPSPSTSPSPSSSTSPSPSPSSSPSPPPPYLLRCTHTTMTFSPAPWTPPDGQKVRYYRLYGRVSRGSNVRVRLSDKAYPGLGMEVPAGPDSVLEVKGLQPNVEYVFAVAAYDREGQLLGQQTGKLSGRPTLQMGQLSGRPTGGSIGETGRPIVACYPLPVLAAWGYCCQCAYTAGVREVALTAADVLWTHYVATVNTEGEPPEYRFKPAALTSDHHALLHHFLHSVFIHTHLTSPPLPSLPHHDTPQRHTQLRRVELCNRLLLVLEGSGVADAPSLCLQAVVLCHGLLAPLLQRDIATPSIARVLLHCQCVLAEMPDHLLSHSHTSTQSALHHIIATSAFHLSKMLLQWQKTNLFSSLSDNGRGLLLLTMPAAALAPLCLRNPEIALDQSAGTQSLSSYTTASSGFPGLLIPRGAGHRKRKGKKKTNLAEQISDEAKSAEYKAFEAFIMSNCNSLTVPPQLDSSDITGQEDPMLLHAVIASLPAVQAYKEVHKFRRRPQYLEFFVHMASAGMEQGQQHLVLEWGHDTFTWLARRNEILLTTRPVHVSTKPHSTLRHTKHTLTSSHPPSHSLLTKNTHAASDRRSRASSRLGDSQTIHRKCESSVALAVVQGGTTVAGKGRRSRKGRSSVLNETLARLLALEGVTVTREDLELKASSVLQASLPDTWRNHKCRKRLREVCKDELPWRAQANIQLAQCYLDQLLSSLERGSEGEGEGGGGSEREGSLLPPDKLRLEGAGVIINGVIPTYPPATPGYTLKHLTDAVPVLQGTDLTSIVGGGDPEGSRDRNPNSQGGSRAPGSPPGPQHPQQQLAEMMRCLQRAVVLAQRGGLWVLLQNACRSLWNAVSCLVRALQNRQETTDTAEVEGVSVAAVYGMASKPLYFVMETTTDLIAVFSRSPDCPLPPLSLPDTALYPDFAFLRRLTLLAAHTMYAQEHWESLVSAGLRLCAGVREAGGEEGRGWGGDLVSVVMEAQRRLGGRVKEHGADLKREAVEPAAHLDPGRDGHDIYRTVGQALARVCVPLDPQTALDNLQIARPIQDGPVHTLQQCRRLLARYLAGESITVSVEATFQRLSSLDADSVDLAPLPPSQLPLLVNSYNEAITQLEAGGSIALAAYAMHELGNLHFHSHNTKLAGRWWGRALSLLLQCRDPLKSWRERVRGKETENCGVAGAMLAGIAATKLARYVYANKMNASLEYLLMAAALFKRVPMSSLPHHSSDLSFLLTGGPAHTASLGTLPSHTATPPTPGVELFSDPLLCDPVTSLAYLQYCSRELVGRRHAIKAGPVLWLYHYVAHSVCRDAPHTVICRTLQLQALTQLHMFPEALSLLGELLRGAGLAQSSCHHDCPPEMHSAAKFSGNLPLNDPKNIKALTALAGLALPASVAGRCGEEAVLRLSLARAELYTALAATCTTVPPQGILTRAAEPSLPRPLSTLPSPAPTPHPSQPSSEVNLLGSSSPALPPASRSGRAAVQKLSEPHLVKVFLVQHAEKLLVGVCRSLSSVPSLSSSPPSLHLELRARALLSLSRLSLSLQHNSTAIQLSLAALRLLQTPSITLPCGVWLWAESRRCLAESLMGWKRGGDMLACAVQCEEGVREAEEYGDAELAAEFHYTAALHALYLSPPNLQAITTHTQHCLQCLQSLASPSPSSSLLRARCTLLLCDAGLRAGHVTSCDATQVYRGLVTMLRKQLSDATSPPSSYHPAHLLLASSLLRLSLSLLADHSQSQEALSLCVEGLEVLRGTQLTDPCLMTSLLTHRVLLLQKIPLIERSEVTNKLLEAIRNTSDCKADYRLQFASCFELAWLLSEAIQQQKQAMSSVSLETHSSDGVVQSKSSRGASRMTRTKPSTPHDGEGGEREAGVEKWRSQVEVKREAYMAWCALKTARQALLARESFQRLTSQLHNPDLAKTVPERALADMPDFALLELCGGDSVLDDLLRSVGATPIDLLSPSAQPVRPATLTWFQVVSHAYSILTRCFWEPSTAGLLDIHSLTASLHAKYHALASFLQQYCPAFSKSCSLPVLPPSLLQTPPPPSTQQHSTGSGSSTHVTIPLSADSLSHLRAGEGEVTVVWHRPPPHSLLAGDGRSGEAGGGDLAGREQGSPDKEEGEEESGEKGHEDALLDQHTSSGPNAAASAERGREDERSSTLNGTASRGKGRRASEDAIVGVIGFNQKAVKPPQQPNAPSPRVEVFTVQVSCRALSRLRDEWAELSRAAQGYLDGHVTGRPVSRSPSRQRKHAEKTQRLQAGLQEKMSDGVKWLCTALGRRVDEDADLPHLEPHLLEGVSSLLPPPSLPSSLTAQGDVYHFMHTLFTSTQPHPLTSDP